MSTDNPKDEFPELADAFDLWREDAARTARGIDVHGNLADRIIAAVEARPAPRVVSTAARWYAAAAVLLIGIGVTGTLLARTPTPTEPRAVHELGDLDDELIHNFLVLDPAVEPGLGR